MRFLTTFAIALKALGKNKMRAGLTVLGVVIGIAAVTTMVSIGQSASALVRGELEGFGTNVIVIQPAQRRRGGVRRGLINTLTSKDADAITDECDAIMATTPLVGTGGQVVYGNLNVNPNEMFGVGADYLLVRSWTIKYGAFFDDAQIDRAEKVCVVGKTIVTKLFQTGNPINEKIRINNKPFTIIGVLEDKGANMVGEDQDSVILMPHTTVRRTLNGSSFDDVHAIIASAVSPEKMSLASTEIKQLLMDRHNISAGQKVDFEVQTTTEIANMLGMVTGTMTLMLSSIAGISLLVGGVGIMNIMLVSVTERTREIGIRMAVGARSRDILMQFLVESVLLSCIGGLIGFALGVGASVWTDNRDQLILNWNRLASNRVDPRRNCGVFVCCPPSEFSSDSIRRAAPVLLDPIDALRYE